MPVLRVLYLSFPPPPMWYRPWAGTPEFSLLSWHCRRLVERYGSTSFIVACHDTLSHEIASQLTRDLGIFIARCTGSTAHDALAEIAATFPRATFVWFSPELALAPTRLLDEALDHHLRHHNRATRVEGIPATMAPVIYSPSGAGEVPFPFQFAATAEPPVFFDSLDAERTRQALADLPPTYEDEAWLRWTAATASPTVPSFPLPQPNRPRILFSALGSTFSGPEQCLTEMVRHLGPAHFDPVALVAFDGCAAERFRQAGCQVSTPGFDFHQHPGFCDQFLDQCRPHLVHFNGIDRGAFLEAVKRRRIPAIAHVRAAAYPTNAPELRAAHTIVAVSDFIRRQLLHGGIHPDRITVIHDGVDTRYFRPKSFPASEARRLHGIPPEAFLLLFIAHPSPIKRHDLVLRALARLLTGVPNAHLAIVGSWGASQYLAQIHNLAASLGVQKHVSWIPFQTDLRALYAAADALVQFSDGEALGTAVLEAMACGLPTLVSDSGAMTEMVTNGVNGLVSPSGDWEALGETMCRLAADPDLRAELGRNARLQALNQFDVRRRAARFGQLLDSLTC